MTTLSNAASSPAVAPAPPTTDKHRRKRLKVVSACLECRRKKTKCNGETPCAGCIKAKVDCKYVSTLQQQHASRSRSAAAGAPPVARHHQHQHQHHHTVPTTAAAAAGSTFTGPATLHAQGSRTTVDAIEQRLTVIEDILRALLKDRTATQGYFSQSHTSLATATAIHAPHVHNWYPTRDWPHTPLSSTSSTLSSASSTTRSSSSAFHLPPLRQQQQQQQQPSSSSIRSLLNEHDDLPTPPPTATFFEKEPVAPSATRHYPEYYMTP